jgi:hypothetical protein
LRLSSSSCRCRYFFITFTHHRRHHQPLCAAFFLFVLDRHLGCRRVNPRFVSPSIFARFPISLAAQGVVVVCTVILRRHIGL